MSDVPCCGRARIAVCGEFVVVVVEGRSAWCLTEIGYEGENNNSIKQSNTEASEDVAPVMLVVGDPRHHRVPRHHDQNELDAMAEELRTSPREAFVEVHRKIDHSIR